MAKKLESPTSLTEFAPLSPEISAKTFSFRNLFWRKKKEDEVVLKEDSANNLKNNVDTAPVPLGNTDSSCNFKSEAEASFFQSRNQPDVNSESLDIAHNRNMTSILKMIRNIVDGKKEGLQNYKDSDFKQYWMPDSNCKECYDCGDRFTTFRRRHHCRVCGQIFCRRCCNQGIPGSFIGYTRDLRVCTYCFRMVSSCMQPLDSSSEMPEDLQSFHDNLQHKLIHLQSQTERAMCLQQNMPLPCRRKSSVIGFREEDIAKAKPSKTTLNDFRCNVEYGSNNAIETSRALQDGTYLTDLFNQLMHPLSGISFKKDQHMPNPLIKPVHGCDIVEWLVNNNAAASRVDAANIGQAFVDANFLESGISHQERFIDGDVLYKPRQFENSEMPHVNSATESQESMEPLWVKEIQTVDSCSKDGSAEDSQQFSTSPCDTPTTEPRSRISSSSSMFYLNLDLKESRVSVSRPLPDRLEQRSSSNMSTGVKRSFKDGAKGISPENLANLDYRHFNEGMQDTFAENFLRAFNANQLDSSAAKPCISFPEKHSLHHNKDNDGEKKAFEMLNLAYKSLEMNLLLQLLSNQGLSLSWCDIILPIIHRVIDIVHPDVKNDADDMDIRQYVQFKKIPGGTKAECTIVSGVVFSKTVAHRKMEQNIFEPTLLLLSSPIAYQRIENKLSSLDPIIMQEFEYLKNTIGKLTVCKPDILLVEKTVSRLAQEMLLALGITVALNVKQTVMERVARCTQAAIVSTVDAHLGRPQLGTCQEFKVKTFSIHGGKTKTLMFLDGCPANLGCTILLRGGSANELKKVKQIIQFMLYVAYNWQLERSFLLDEFAVPPYELLGVADSENETQENIGLFEISVSESSEEKKNDNVFHHDLYISSSHSSCCNTDSNTNSKCKSRIDDCNKKLETKSVDDFSDPLHSYLRSENDMLACDSSNLVVTSLPVSSTFRKLLDDIILCCSLNIKVSLPYLETEAGKNCQLRKYFPNEIYWSPHFAKENESEKLLSTQMNFDDENTSLEMQISSGNVEILPSHNFTSYKFTDVWDRSIDLYSLLSDFRARGGTIRYLCPHECAVKEKEKKVLMDINNSSGKEASKSNEMHTNTGLCWERKVDALDPYNHQTLAVLFCSYSCTSNNAPNYCVNPWIVKMDFYGCNDIPLGGFLERYCFRSSYVCPSSTCDTSMTEHVRKFVHGSGCVHILLHELSTGVRTAENSILMWNWCHKCKKASPVVPMSQDTWSFSFAKYLELRFHATSYGRRGINELCSHSLHHDHYQYFAHKQVVAIFEYTPIIVWEVALPSLAISVHDEALPVASVVEQIKYIAITGYGIYSTVLEKLFALKEEYTGTNCEDIVSSMIATQKIEMSTFREKIEQIQLRLTSPTLENMQMNASHISPKYQNKEICSFMWRIADQVTLLKHHIAEAVQLWNNRIQDFVAARKKEEKLPLKTSQPVKVHECDEAAVNNDPLRTISEDNAPEPLVTYESESASLKTHEGVKSCEPLIEKQHSASGDHNSFDAKGDDVNQDILTLLQIKKHNLQRCSWIERSVSWESVSESMKVTNFPSQLVKAYSEPRNLTYTSINQETCKSFQEEDRHSYSSSGSSYTYGVTPGIYAGLMVPEPEDSESYVVCHKESCHQHSVRCSSKGHERSKSEGNEMLTEQILKISQEQRAEEGTKRDKKEHTVKTLLSQFLSSPVVSPIQSPFPLSQHIFISKLEKVPIIVYDDEPSSVIAYTLASTEYEQQLQELRVNISSTFSAVQRDSQSSSPMIKRRQNSKIQNENASGSESPLLSNDESSADFMDLALCSSQEADRGHKVGNKMPNFHLEIQFSNSNARFYCRVYYAEQFRKLRCLVFNKGEERFLRSLSRCIPWIARGGKSGSTFCKTHDDRFILKQMPKLELQSFLDLAPSYFQYINKACLEQKPTLLAKIVGVYRIGYKNTATNTAVKMDLLVMENLFYGCNINRKYDLKGSIRNRLVNTSGIQEDDIVLLDENLLKITCDNPLYMRPHSKTVLTLAISNDTQFLSNQSVMDYSLLVGLDEEKKELVVGIIDYIRTFTWDKKVEMLVKSSGILGGHGKMPTVVQPEMYRVRFCEAMDGYFLWVPDRWTTVGKGVDS